MSAVYGANYFLPPSPVRPQFLLVSNITQSNPCVVTVTTANEFVVNQMVYFSIPFSYGMFQINTLSGKILSVDITNLVFSVDIDTIQFDAFVIPAFGEPQPATISPSGSRNLDNLNTNLRLVPFHSEGNFGN